MSTVHPAAVEPAELPARLTAPPRLTQRHPWLLPAAMAVHRARRRTQWVRDAWSGRVVWAEHRDDADLPVRLKQHGSLLLRELDPGQMHLQHNKVTTCAWRPPAWTGWWSRRARPEHTYRVEARGEQFLRREGRVQLRTGRLRARPRRVRHRRPLTPRSTTAAARP